MSSPPALRGYNPPPPGVGSSILYVPVNKKFIRLKAPLDIHISPL